MDGYYIISVIYAGFASSIAIITPLLGILVAVFAAELKKIK